MQFLMDSLMRSLLWAGFSEEVSSLRIGSSNGLYTAEGFEVQFRVLGFWFRV